MKRYFKKKGVAVVQRWLGVGRQGRRERKRIQEQRAKTCLSTWKEELRGIKRLKVVVMRMLNKR